MQAPRRQRLHRLPVARTSAFEALSFNLARPVPAAEKPWQPHVGLTAGTGLPQVRFDPDAKYSATTLAALVGQAGGPRTDASAGTVGRHCELTR